MTTTEDDLLVTNGQLTAFIIRVKDVTGITFRDERLWLATQCIDRDLDSFKDLTQGEFHEAMAYLARIDGTPMALILAQEARTACEEGLPPEEKSEPVQGLPVQDLGGAGKEIIRTTMKKVMAMSGAEAGRLLKQFGEPTPNGGTASDKKLRLFEYCCRERAKGNEEVEAMW